MVETYLWPKTIIAIHQAIIIMYPKRIQPQPLYEIMFSFCFFFSMSLSIKKERGMVGNYSILLSLPSPLPGLYICLLRSNVSHAALAAFVDSCAELTLSICRALLFRNNKVGATNAFCFHIICSLILLKRGAVIPAWRNGVNTPCAPVKEGRNLPCSTKAFVKPN